MSTKKQAKEARERRKRNGSTIQLAKKRKPECGACSLCRSLDAPLPAPSIRCGVVEIEREDDRSRVGLSTLHPEAGHFEGCLWRQGRWGGTLDTRPDRVGIVPAMFGPPGHKLGDYLLFVDPRHPTSYNRNQTRKLILNAIGQGRDVFINDGSGRLKFAKMEARLC
ncbi:unnamed protein product [marine sediment metagenome]|uniref:Uncharacterized protein n=1 Tax=marine sediment metagenome TaxID=412755 RepID=X0WY08_9ZZZZ